MKKTSRNFLFFLGTLSFVLSACSTPSEETTSSSLPGGETFVPVRYESNGVPLEQYRIVISASANATAQYAASELRSYVAKATGIELPIAKDDTPESPYEILLGETARKETANLDFASFGEEAYAIKTAGEDLLISANPRRGLLYGVYAFLEALGYRYYTPTVEKIPSAEEVFVPKAIELSWVPEFTYRETMFENAWDVSFAVKQKINSDFQRPELKHNPKYGGFRGYIGGARYLVHTFKILLPFSTHASAHPDWYAQNVGPSYTDPEHLQPCFSNFDSIDAVMGEVERLLKEDPTSNILSISQNDGGEYCQCAKCVEGEKTYGKSGVMLRYVNEIARRVKVNHPDVKIDTLAYDWSLTPPKGVVAEDNVTIRFCTEMCAFHDDERPCDLLKEREQYFIDWQKCAKEFSVWTYPINFVNYYNAWPNFYELKYNVEFYLDHGVKSIYQEGYHRVSAEFAELKAYVLSKLNASPRMSDAEYEYHIRDFLKGYYGEGWKHIRSYLDFAHEKIRENVDNFGCISVKSGPDDLFDFGYDGTSYDMDLIQAMNGFWEKALDLSDETTFPRVEKSSLHWTYIELYCTFDARYLNGNEEEMAELEARNRDLYEKLKHYGAIYRYSEKTINMNVSDFKSSPATW